MVTPEKTVLDSVSVKEILVPGEKGEMGILPGHAPLISTLGSGILKYRLLKEEKAFKEVALSWGYVEVQPEKVVVLAESAETKKALDKDKAQQALSEVLEKLKNANSPEEIRTLRREEQKQRTFLKL